MELDGDEPTHTITDYYAAIAWNLIGMENDVEYYKSVRQELRNILKDYRGVRLRDIKSCFEERTEAELDLNRLGIRSWCTFLLTARDDINFKKDLAKDEVWAYPSNDDDAHNADADADALQNLVTCEAKKAFLDGYLNCANGIPMKDRRIPHQDLGVAAAAAKHNAELRRKREAGKKTFEKQIDIAKPNKAIVTIETTNPFEATKTGSIETAMAAMMVGIEKEPVSSIMSIADVHHDLDLSPKYHGASGSGSYGRVAGTSRPTSAIEEMKFAKATPATNPVPKTISAEKTKEKKPPAFLRGPCLPSEPKSSKPSEDDW